MTNNFAARSHICERKRKGYILTIHSERAHAKERERENETESGRELFPSLARAGLVYIFSENEPQKGHYTRFRVCRA